MTAVASTAAAPNRLKALLEAKSPKSVVDVADVIPASLPVPHDWAPLPGVTIDKKVVTNNPTIRIAGEPFYLEIEDGVFYIRHRSWSLVGAGDSAVQALRDLLSDAKGLARVMSEMPRNSFDSDAFDLYRFVLRVG